MEEKNNSRIWPVLYFQAEWSEKVYNFGLGIQLIRADKDILQELEVCPDPYSEDNIRDNTDWFLALRIPSAIDHVPANEIGFSFASDIQEDIVGSFLMCLRLVRSTSAICPIDIKVEISGDSIKNPETQCCYGLNTEEPFVYLPETFKEEDVQLLTDLWSVLIKLRNMDYWINLVSKEEFFAGLDKKAGEQALNEMVKFLMSHPAYRELSEEERKLYRKKWAESINKKSIIEDEWTKEYYTIHFRKVFSEIQDEVFANRTRIGRALKLFDEGIRLPTLHSFLSMSLVLETLFTIGEGEILHKLAVRIARIVGKEKSFEERKDIYKKTKKVYAARSDIVHGEKLIDAIDSKVLEDAFLLTRQSLQAILLDNELLKLYSNSDISKSTNDVREFFLKLDLQGDRY